MYEIRSECATRDDFTPLTETKLMHDFLEMKLKTETNQTVLKHRHNVFFCSANSIANNVFNINKTNNSHTHAATQNHFHYN